MGSRVVVKVPPQALEWGNASVRFRQVRSFDYFAPQTLAEAVALLHELGEHARPLAGGTDLIVQMKEAATRFPYPSSVVGLTRIPELKGIEFSESAGPATDLRTGLRIGAGVTMMELAESPAIRQRFQALAEGAGVVGSYQTMNMATLGGNLCNAAPSADSAPPLLAFEAQAVIVGPGGRRTLPLDQFFTGPGHTALAPGEVLAEVRVPAPAPGTGSAYRRHTPRKQMDIAVVGAGVVLTLGADSRIEKARIALGAVAPTPIRARQAESLLEGQSPSAELFQQAAEAAAAEASPISDVRGSADFRRHLVKVLTARMLGLAAERAKG